MILRRGNHRLLYAFLALCCLVPQCPVRADGSGAFLSAAEIERVDAAVAHVMGSKVPGVSLAVIRDGVPAYARGYGVMDLAGHRPITATTRMEIGSVTMQFTAAAILQLSEAGKLSLDDKLGKYVPEYSAGRDITLRQLLELQSGIVDYYPIDDAEAGKIFTRKASVQDVLALFADKPLAFPPGSRFAFNNTDYFLLGLVVERVSGLGYNVYLKRNIFDRAGMTRSTTVSSEPRLSDFPSGYWHVGGAVGKAPRLEDGWGLATFNIVSDVGDLAKWDAALFGGKIVNRDDIVLMETPAMLSDGKPSPLGYGMGWFSSAIETHKMLRFQGGSLGFGAMNAVFPDDHLELIAEVNATSTVIVPQAITTAVFEALYPEIAAKRLIPAIGEDAAITAKAKKFVLALQAGSLEPIPMTEALREKLTPGKLEQIKAVLTRSGEISSFVFKGWQSADDIASFDYLVLFDNQNWSFQIGFDPAGMVASLSLSPA